ncbi:MAG: hypothetical protein ACRD3R_07755 [Terriglobales bacterium]
MNRRFQPPPRYNEGFILRDATGPQTDSPVGRMFVQPKVSVGADEPVLFDETVGNNFAVIAFKRDSRELLDGDSLDFWKSLGTRFVRIEPAGDKSESDGHQVTVVDIDGVFAQWFAGREDHIVLLRPDRYVIGVVQAGRINAATSEIRNLTAALPERRVPNAEPGDPDLAKKFAA